MLSAVLTTPFHADILFISSNISSMLAIEKDKVY
jgi:hypothetical protein